MGKELDDAFGASAPGDEAVADDAAAEAGVESDVVEADAGEADDGASKAAKPQRTVPLQALDEARLEQKRLKDDLRAANDKIGRMNQRFEDVLKLFQQPKQEQQKDDTPPIDEEPLANLDTRMRRIEADRQKGQQLTAQQREVSAALEEIGAVEADFARTQKDYFKALEFLRTKRAEELELLHPAATPAQRKKIQDDEEYFFARANIKAGRNPAELAYNFAKKAGYQPEGAAAPDGKKSKAAEKIEALKKGAEAATSITDLGGDEPDLTLERLADLEGEEFSKAFDRLVGGGRTSNSLNGLFGK